MEILNICLNRREVEQWHECSAHIACATPFSIEVITDKGSLSYILYWNERYHTFYIKNNLPALYDGKVEDTVYVRRTNVEEIFSAKLVGQLHQAMKHDVVRPHAINQIELKIYFFELLRLELISEKMLGALSF